MVLYLIADTTVARALYDGKVVYMSGRDINSAGGHAWVIDNGHFCWTNPENIGGEITNVFLHCNWGWGGTYNGYFSGAVFNVGSVSFNDMSFFTVGKEW